MRGELETLQHVATQLINAPGMEALYDKILDTALAILHADLTSIQMVDAGRIPTGNLSSRPTRDLVHKPPRAGNGWAKSEDLEAFLPGSLIVEEVIGFRQDPIRSGAMEGCVEQEKGVRGKVAGLARLSTQKSERETRSDGTTASTAS